MAALGPVAGCPPQGEEHIQERTAQGGDSFGLSRISKQHLEEKQRVSVATFMLRDPAQLLQFMPLFSGRDPASTALRTVLRGRERVELGSQLRRFQDLIRRCQVGEGE